MAVYNLEETPDIFIAPKYYGDEFTYSMEHIEGENNNRKIIRSIDLRSDKLMVHGTHINESMSKKLYEALVMKPGIVIFVSSEGACYFYMKEKGCYRPIHNIIFDWSRFGVILPDSVNSSLTKQLEQKETEVEELRKELSACKMDCQDLGVKLQKVCEQVSLIDFEVELYKIEMESYKKDIEELLDQLSTSREETRNMEVELQKVKSQLFTVNYELHSTKNELESSRKSVNDLDCQLSISSKEKEELKSKLNEHQHAYTSISSKLHSQQEASNEVVEKLQKQLSSHETKTQEMEANVRKAQDQLSIVGHELISTKETLFKDISELRNQLSTSKKESQDMATELQKLQDALSAVNFECRATKSQLEYSTNRVIELEEQPSTSRKENEYNQAKRQQVQDHFSAGNEDLLSIDYTLLDITKEKLKHQDEEVEVELLTVKPNYVCPIPSARKPNTQNLFEVLISL